MIQVQDIFEHNNKSIAKYQLMIVRTQVEQMMNEMSKKSLLVQSSLHDECIK
jgi:hypothetical protein